ncbi:MAG: L-glutamate gamma-semialdehyde dehydrogenase [Deltaproteobacteria bacterium]|nr:L-glutamate gamma-semialdehyde dehydrogenase [Deltaproteobacteria bacterium]
MENIITKVPEPRNEPILTYVPGSSEAKQLQEELARLLSSHTEIPAIINGKPVKTGQSDTVRLPHQHKHTVAIYHKAGVEEIRAAVSGSQEAWRTWAFMPYEDRAAIFLKAADLLAGPYRSVLNAATMLGQSKTCHQAEIDSACELIDFFRFNAFFQQQLYAIQPNSAAGQWNKMEYRPLEGFVLAVTPFNFTSIAGNLPCSAALMGNVVLWKPATTSLFSSYFIMKLLEEAGLPPGVIQFLPSSGEMIGKVLLNDPLLAGIHFTGSTGTFQKMWKTVGDHISTYRSYPRLVGETGGKDFIFAHPSADISALMTAMVRGAFEYQGQKCSAASRAYIPTSVWKKLREPLLEQVRSIRMGDITDFRNFMGAVIDRASFTNIQSYLEHARKSNDVEILVGGKCSDEIGYFVEPTIIEAKNPSYKTMCEEIFGPVLTVYVYDDKRFEETLSLCDDTSPYALTGSIFSQDRNAVVLATKLLTHSAGNFYINNKPTGAVVGQQPFGGSRGSGTNDKAGSLFNLLRWVSMRTISETFNPPTSYRYPFMG